MLQNTISRLEYLCNTIPKLVLQINEVDFEYKSAPNKWSKKEIIGHLIDSATNNHQRFVRGQFEELPVIIYKQNEWNNCSNYQKMESKKIISFWEAYNRFLIDLIRYLPEENLIRLVNTGENRTVEFLINDYVTHLEHHLKQVVYYG